MYDPIVWESKTNFFWQFKNTHVFFFPDWQKNVIKSGFQDHPSWLILAWIWTGIRVSRQIDLHMNADLRLIHPDIAK